MSQTQTLVIGLDFGTTFSGVAYCDSTRKSEGPGAVQVIQSWPGMGGMANTEKVPSRIAYGQPPKVEILWGNQIKPNTKAKVHALMKLKLDERLRKSKQLKMLLAFLRFDGLEGLDLNDSGDDEDDGPPDYPGKEPVEVVADYLTEVRKHVYTELSGVYNGGLFDSLNKELVVTVPAVWSEKAKDLTLKAVTKAQFNVNKISLVTEPEAAAIYTLMDMKEGPGQDQIQIGDCFVLCDAGGGTVDLISYRITQLRPTLRVEEAAIGSGDKCGATYVDKEFLSWLEKKLGTTAFKHIPPAKTRHGSALMNAFETAKMHFEGKPEEVQITLPKECGIEDDVEKGIEDRELTVTDTDLKEIFNPCVNRTLELIDGQIAAILSSGHRKPKLVLCVGGFGRNEYLNSKIVEYCNDRNIGTRRPQFPWSAVVRGAVCRGLEGPQAGLVAVRLSRKHWGTYASEAFNPKKHSQEDMYVDEFDGARYAKGQMTWLVAKGERFPESHPKKAFIEVCRQFKVGEDRVFGAVLVGCDEDSAPQRYAHKDAYNVCKVTADLNSVPEHKFMRCRSGLNSEEFLMCEIKLEATWAEDKVTWNFIFDGKTYGSTSVTYDT
ncbi:hypothetical protein BGZ60DRAFT_401802 [Tricladium varicosporioides]|nr:hypothetical protein BGZ60DRAFT_401802 [Hymenoscyphus varicosporioides]